MNRPFRKVVSGVMFGGILLFSGTPVFATPSTHIWAPSTDVQPYGVMHLTSDAYVPVERDAAENRPDTVTNMGLTVGVLPLDKLNAEVGFDHKSGLGALDDTPMYFNAKVGVPENAFFEFSPAVAGGIYDVGTDNDLTDFNLTYIKTAKTFYIDKFSLGRVSAGYFNGNDKLLLDGNGEKDNNGFFGAWERSLPEISDKLWVAVEYQGTESAYGTWNFGFSWKFSDNASVIFAYDRYNNRDLADTFTIQVDIDFDVFSKLFKKAA
ncbi:MAG: hypothetical protein A3C47_00030 [Omnitrophica bacterium RIFCSPHIGHO2_02_FULL_51_18]|nr:MAG: hypothetical protein A3C47_00030 [Omnitrophica bacterium RIFCSPHIGHO2_02_FULL_51_18]